MAAWKLQTDLTSKVKLNALIDQYKNEAKSLGAKIIAEKRDLLNLRLKLKRKRLLLTMEEFYPIQGEASTSGVNDLALYISIYIPLWGIKV